MKIKIFLFCTLCVVTINGILNAQVISTFAGSGVMGFSGNGIPALMAKLNDIFDIAIDNYGNVYVADRGNGVIWKINSAGIISIYAGTGVSSHTGNGGPATAATLF